MLESVIIYKMIFIRIKITKIATKLFAFYIKYKTNFYLTFKYIINNLFIQI